VDLQVGSTSCMVFFFTTIRPLTSDGLPSVIFFGKQAINTRTHEVVWTSTMGNATLPTTTTTTTTITNENTPTHQQHYRLTSPPPLLIMSLYQSASQTFNPVEMGIEPIRAHKDSHKKVFMTSTTLYSLLHPPPPPPSSPPASSSTSVSQSFEGDNERQEQQLESTEMPSHSDDSDDTWNGSEVSPLPLSYNNSPTMITTIHPLYDSSNTMLFVSQGGGRHGMPSTTPCLFCLLHPPLPISSVPNGIRLSTPTTPSTSRTLAYWGAHSSNRVRRNCAVSMRFRREWMSRRCSVTGMTGIENT